MSERNKQEEIWADVTGFKRRRKNKRKKGCGGKERGEKGCGRRRIKNKVEEMREREKGSDVKWKKNVGTR